MWKLLVLVSLIALIGLTSGVDVSTRPKNCAAGTTYKKDCNTCTCSADGKDKCSQIDCSRNASNAGPTTPSSNASSRPGDCPTVVTPAPGSDVCKNRNQTSTCTVDKDCSQAKKCCVDGCKRKLCRNAIYRYTK